MRKGFIILSLVAILGNKICAQEGLWEAIQSHKISETQTVGEKFESLDIKEYTVDTFSNGCDGNTVIVIQSKDKIVEIPVVIDEYNNTIKTIYEHHRDNDTSLIIVDTDSVSYDIKNDFGIFDKAHVDKLFASIYHGNISDVISYELDMVDSGIYFINVYTKNGNEMLPVPESLLTK